MKCKPESRTAKLALLAACKAGDEIKAKLYFGKLGEPPGGLTNECVLKGIKLP
jgi:hypothetical protein